MTMNQKKALYALGSPDRWYRCMFFNLRLEMEAYLCYEKAFDCIVSGCSAAEWEDDEYDPDEV